MFHAEGIVLRPAQATDVFQGNARPFFESQSVANVVSYLAFGFGFLGVPLFFVISGFCIHLPLAGKSTPLDPRSFAIRRFFRLYPLYFIVFVCVMALARRPSTELAPTATWASFLGHLVLLALQRSRLANGPWAFRPCFGASLLKFSFMFFTRSFCR